MDLEYVKDAATGVAHYVRRGQVCELAFMPGNMTLYELVVLPADAMSKASGWMDHEKARSIREDRPELAEAAADSWVVLGWLGHGCWPVDLAAVWTADYLAEKFSCSPGDGEALRALLLEVADQMGLRRLQVIS